MVINDRYLLCSRFGPSENNSPLIVHPNGMESGESPLESLQTISRGHREVRQLQCLIDLDELSQGYS